ncbi:hypothetical protein M0D21_04070 [Aquimarina sp. D1M17]|uniref:DUF6134 family protein n=1 Tax=Aquimarina acroporae TaxID=2937283 RepID=UPI0020C136CC|nr:DUF6134 family protein [Aquimarina acroporae]MCK8520726.1 hypothetical protein [Aquimarina acroporae]
MNLRLFSSTFTSLILSVSISAQTQIYDIISKKDTLGMVTVSKSNKENITYYHYNVDMTAKLLINVHMKYMIKATYVSGYLLSASVQNMVNGKPYHSNEINWQDTYYSITSKSKKQQKVLEKINYSGIRLFFDEPREIKKVFSEYTGQFGNIQKINANSYELTLHNGKKNKYHYHQNILEKATINNSLIHFDLILRK